MSLLVEHAAGADRVRANTWPAVKCPNRPAHTAGGPRQAAGAASTDELSERPAMAAAMMLLHATHGRYPLLPILYTRGVSRPNGLHTRVRDVLPFRRQHGGRVRISGRCS